MFLSPLAAAEKNKSLTTLAQKQSTSFLPMRSELISQMRLFLSRNAIGYYDCMRCEIIVDLSFDLK